MVLIDVPIYHSTQQCMQLEKAIKRKSLTAFKEPTRIRMLMLYFSYKIFSAKSWFVLVLLVFDDFWDNTKRNVSQMF